MIRKFPFGQSLVPVKQQDRSPKKIFILGVYASAVYGGSYPGLCPSNANTRVVDLYISEETRKQLKPDG